LTCQHYGNALDTAKILKVGLIEGDVNAKLLFQLEEEFNELEGVEDSSFEQIGVIGRHLNVQL
jgi:hypothetical protein